MPVDRGLEEEKKLKVACFLFWPTWPVFISGGILCIFCPKHSPSFQLSCRCVPQIEFMTSEIAVTNYLAGSMLCLQNQCGGYVCHIFSFSLVVRFSVRFSVRFAIFVILSVSVPPSRWISQSQLVASGGRMHGHGRGTHKHWKKVFGKVFISVQNPCININPKHQFSSDLWGVNN